MTESPAAGWRLEVSPRMIAAAAAAGVVSGFLFWLSPLTVLWALWMVAFFHLAGRDLPEGERRWLRGFLLTGLALRVGAVVALLLLSGSDSQSAGILFGDEGYLLRRSWRLRNAWLGFQGSPYDYVNAFEEYASSGYLYLVGYLQVLAGPAPYALRLLNAGVFITAVYLLYRLARRAYGAPPALVGLPVVLFLPSLFSWSISLLKESAYVLVTAGAITLVANAVKASAWRLRIGWAAAAVGCIALLWPLRPQGVAIMVAALAMALFLWWVAERRRRILVVAVATLVLVGVLVQSGLFTGQLLALVQAAAREHGGHAFTVGHAYKTLDTNFYLVPTFHSWTLTPPEAARFVIRSLGAFLLVPLPWQVTSTSELVYLPEQMLWYLMVVLTLVGVWRAFRDDSLVTSLLLSYVLVASAAVALTSGNVGTLIRHRSLSVPFLVWLAAVGLIRLLEDMARISERTGERSKSKGMRTRCH